MRKAKCYMEKKLSRYVDDRNVDVQYCTSEIENDLHVH